MFRFVSDRNDLQCDSKNRTITFNMTSFHQFTTFTNYFWHTEIQFSIAYDKKFLNWLRTSCVVVSITTAAT